MNPVDFNDLVNRVSDIFQNQYGIPIGQDARQELITPALPYQQHVDLAMAADTITIEFLETSIEQVLQNARTIAQERGEGLIGRQIILDSMQRYCPYLFWC